MSFEIQRYDPDLHANAVPRYARSHVVVGEVPLPKIEFDPRYDELANIEAVGHRMPGSCPRFNELTADASEPPIQGAEPTQHLTIDCPAYAEVRVRPTAYPICSIRADALNLDLDRIPTEWLTGNTAAYQQFRCPFSYLGGAVVDSQASVEIAVTTDDTYLKYDAI